MDEHRGGKHAKVQSSVIHTVIVALSKCMSDKGKEIVSLKEKNDGGTDEGVERAICKKLNHRCV